MPGCVHVYNETVTSFFPNNVSTNRIETMTNNFDVRAFKSQVSVCLLVLLLVGSLLLHLLRQTFCVFLAHSPVYTWRNTHTTHTHARNQKNVCVFSHLEIVSLLEIITVLCFYQQSMFRFFNRLWSLFYLFLSVFNVRLECCMQ